MALQESEGMQAPPPPSSHWEEGAGERPADRATYQGIRNWIDDLARRGLRIEVDRRSGQVVLHLHGRLDRQSAPALKSGFRQIVALASEFIDVDLAGVDRVDGMGLAALVWAARLARECGPELRLTRLRPYVRKLVVKMNLHHLLQIVEDREPLLMPE